MSGLALIFGAIVGLSLGLTGGGGAIFAVPLLVYGLGVSTREAVMTSLASVGVISFFGFLAHWRRKQVELRTGSLFAVAGMLGAPLGAWIASKVTETVLLLSFAGLMAVVAIRMWSQAGKPGENCHSALGCQRDLIGEMILTRRCAFLLILLGLVTGILSGLFGVGGGFIIVPALVLLTGMEIHRAVGTSLMVIVLVSLSGVVSLIFSGSELSFVVTAWFVGGGLAGLLLGQQIGRHLSGPVLQKVFVVAILVVAVFVTVRNLHAGF